MKKKLKQPSFAAGVHRDEVYAGAELLGLELDDHIRNVIAAMRPIAARARPAHRGGVAAVVPLRPRPARAEDADAIARIYNEGIEDRLATFETRLRSVDDVRRWLDDGFPLVVVEDDGTVVAWASAPPYRPAREAYAGIGDFSVYVARSERRRGSGRTAMEALVAEARGRGYWKLVSRIFPENEASLALCRRPRLPRGRRLPPPREARRRVARRGRRRAAAQASARRRAARGRSATARGRPGRTRRRGRRRVTASIIRPERMKIDDDPELRADELEA